MQPDRPQVERTPAANKVSSPRRVNEVFGPERPISRPHAALWPYQPPPPRSYGNAAAYRPRAMVRAEALEQLSLLGAGLSPCTGSHRDPNILWESVSAEGLPRIPPQDPIRIPWGSDPSAIHVLATPPHQHPINTPHTRVSGLSSTTHSTTLPDTKDRGTGSSSLLTFPIPSCSTRPWQTAG